MGVHRYIYLGPYAEVTYRNETREVETVGCTNPECAEFNNRNPFRAPPTPKFCSTCASPIGKRKRTESYRRTTWDVLQGDENITEFLCGDDKSDKVRLGSNIRGPRKFSHDSDGEFVEDLTHIDRAEEIRWFQETFPADIERLQRAYDDVTVKWGLILYYM